MSVIATQVEHKVKFAIECPAGKARLYVVECHCGWSSALMQSQGAANEAYRAHKRGESTDA